MQLTAPFAPIKQYFDYVGVKGQERGEEEVQEVCKEHTDNFHGNMALVHIHDNVEAAVGKGKLQGKEVLACT